MRCPQIHPGSFRLLAHPVIAASVPAPAHERGRLASEDRMADFPAQNCLNVLTPANQVNVNNKLGSSSLRYLSCRYTYHHAECRYAYVCVDRAADILTPSRWEIVQDSEKYGQFRCVPPDMFLAAAGRSHQKSPCLQQAD